MPHLVLTFAWQNHEEHTDAVRKGRDPGANAVPLLKARFSRGDYGVQTIPQICARNQCGTNQASENSLHCTETLLHYAKILLDSMTEFYFTHMSNHIGLDRPPASSRSSTSLSALGRICAIPSCPRTMWSPLSPVLID